MDLEALYEEVLSGKPACAAVAHRTLWKVTGRDRVRYLNGQVTNDVSALRAGSAIYAALLTAKGRLVADLWIGASGDALWIDGPTSERDSLEARLRQFLAADDVELERLDGWRLTRAFPASSTFTLPTPSAAFRSVRFGLPGQDLWAPGSGVGEIGLAIPESLLESLRLEAGFPQWGTELHAGDLPQEVGMDPLAISYRKGCYVGQEIVSRLHHVGHPNRALVLLTAPPGSGPLQAGSGLWQAEQEVGRVTSVAYSFVRKSPIALGIVKRSSSVPGTPLRGNNANLQVIAPLRTPCGT
ncbi:folate-binding protein YgfZ [Methylacidimicrobium sp. B4]|uniref:CAF17-like 4Fe-4S cluster assembly/insertion protein YgfZ n=1 Tax=Methylacidimicrobium sp. B4 TaxID=2796139 RepID=UPI001A8E114C|nr:folate-binding protein YgfZ [Methylacidimicrobium sp. B4]QSR83916.1 folate-binding protein YgfZ [Methylacidimicrobium sp. B4]